MTAACTTNNPTTPLKARKTNVCRAGTPSVGTRITADVEAGHEDEAIEQLLQADRLERFGSAALPALRPQDDAGTSPSRTGDPMLRA